MIGAYYCALFARASFLFQQDTAASVPAAVKLAPFRGQYVSRLAAWQPANKDALLKRAVQLDPFDYQTWIQRGLISEMQRHDLASAERFYLRGAEVNHMLLPKWTLTNFYFRNENAGEFFRWAKATLQISPYPADPVFAQMWLMSQNPSRIAEAIPDKPQVLLQYTAFLNRTGQFDPIPPIVQRLVRLSGKQNPADLGRDDQILPMEDHILAADHLQPALAIWRSLASAGWIHLSVPTSAAPLTNGDFSNRFLGHGFDWVLGGAAGVSVEQSPSQKTIEITLSGEEPERCVLVQQYVPLAPNHSYHLQWQADGQGLDLPTGLAWHVRSIQSGATSDLATGAVLGNTRVWDFQTSATSNVCLLTFEYARPLGKLRANGTITLRRVVLLEK